MLVRTGVKEEVSLLIAVNRKVLDYERLPGPMPGIWTFLQP